MLAGFNFDLRTWSAPHWLQVGATTVLAAVAGAVLNYVEAVPSQELLRDLMTSQGLRALGHGALAVGLSAGIAAFLGVARRMLAPADQGAAKDLKQGELR